MNSVTESKSLSEYISGISRQKYKMLLVSLLVFSIAAALAFLLPPVYESKATILIEQQAIPQEFVKSTVTSYAEQRIQIISQRAMTRDNLYKIIDKYNLYADDRKSEAIEVIIEEMREDITIDTVNAQVVDPVSGNIKVATIAFTISYKNESPVLVQKVVNELVSLYLNENIKNRTEKALETSGFIGDEAEKLNKQIQQLENEMAEFKENNAGNLPEMVSLNMQMLAGAEKELNDVSRELHLLKEKKLYLTSQLPQIDPYIYGDTSDRLMSPEKQIKALQSRKATLESLYHEDHPDLKRVKKQLSALEAEAQYDSEDLKKQITVKNEKYDKLKIEYPADHPDLKRLDHEIKVLENKLKENQEAQETKSPDLAPDNPLYIQLTTQIDTLGLEQEMLQQKKNELSQKIDLYEDRLASSPQVEMEYRTLARNYENAWQKYRDLKAKLLDAQISEALELDRKAERFALIEPPLAPQKPISPNRMMIIVVGLLFSVIIGFGVAIAFDAIDTAIYSERQIINMIGAPALAIIPSIQTRHDVVKKRLVTAGVVFGGIMIVGFGLLFIHEWYKPLDILWILIQRKLDIV